MVLIFVCTGIEDRHGLNGQRWSEIFSVLKQEMCMKGKWKMTKLKRKSR